MVVNDISFTQSGSKLFSISETPPFGDRTKSQTNSQYRNILYMMLLPACRKISVIFSLMFKMSNLCVP